MFIYHITTKSNWEEQAARGSYIPPTFEKDGFIHCSTAAQVRQVAVKFYNGQPGLIVLEIDPSRQNAQIVFENLEGGSELFPHLYAPLSVSSVNRIYDLPLDHQNTFVFPSIFTPPGI